MKIIFILLVLVGLTTSQFLQSNKGIIISEEIFGISAHCSVAALGNNVAEIQMMRSSHSFMSLDVEKNFEILGIPNNADVNPQKIKTFNVVVNHVTKKRAIYWIDTDNKVHLEKEKSHFGIENFFVPCLMWIQEFLPFTEYYNDAEEAIIEEEEKSMGDIKYSFEEKTEKKRYPTTIDYFLRHDKLSWMVQNIPNTIRTASKIKLEVKDSKILKESQLEKIPEGVQWEDLD